MVEDACMHLPGKYISLSPYGDILFLGTVSLSPKPGWPGTGTATDPGSSGIPWAGIRDRQRAAKPNLTDQLLLNSCIKQAICCIGSE